jgi:outer membrane protein TolC
MQVVVERARAALRLAIGMSQLEPIAIADDALPTERYQFDRQALIAAGLGQRPELQKARAAVQIASLERDARRGQYHPQVGAFASYNTINDDANFPNPNDTAEWAAGVGATMPLYAGGRITAQVRQANYLICQAVEARNFLGRVVEQEVVDALLELEEMDRRLVEAAAAAASADGALESYKAQTQFVEESALPTFYENRLTTRLLLVTAQVRYTQALYSYNVALARIRLAAGMPPLSGFVPEGDDDAPGVDAADVAPAAVASHGGAMR